MATPALTSSALLKKPLYKIRPRSVTKGTTNWLLIKKYTAPEQVIVGEGGKVEVVITEGMGRSQRGTVWAIAPAITDVMVGDMVIYTNYTMEIEDIEDLTGEKDLQLILDEEVYAVCEPLKCPQQ